MSEPIFNREHAKAQNQRIIDYLLEGGRITTMQLMQEPFYCASPTKRISDVRRMLRKKGYKLVGEIISQNGQRFKEHHTEFVGQPSLFDDD